VVDLIGGTFLRICSGFFGGTSMRISRGFFAGTKSVLRCFLPEPRQCRGVIYGGTVIFSGDLHNRPIFWGGSWGELYPGPLLPSNVVLYYPKTRNCGGTNGGFGGEPLTGTIFVALPPAVIYPGYEYYLRQVPYLNLPSALCHYRFNNT
jgi:hypothetical protein